MRIPLKLPYKGYTPALDPFSKDKLIWYKTPKNTSQLLLRLTTIYVIIFLVVSIWLSSNSNNSQTTFLQSLEPNSFFKIFIAAIIVGVIVYIALLFVNDFKEIKTNTLNESIDLYKQGLESIEWQTDLRVYRYGGTISSFLVYLLLAIVAFKFLFEQIHRISSRWWFVANILTLIILVVVLLYGYTIFFSRRYIMRRYKIKKPSNL